MTTNARTSIEVTASALREVGVFGGLDDATLELLAKELPTELFESGAIAIREGENAREMFVILGGELEVLKAGPSGGDVRVAMLGPGDLVGEMAILDIQPRSATVRALAPTTLVRISAEHVDRLLYRRDLKAYALFVMNIARELSRRLRVADALVAQIATSVADGVSKRVTRTVPPRSR